MIRTSHPSGIRRVLNRAADSALATRHAEAWYVATVLATRHARHRTDTTT